MEGGRSDTGSTIPLDSTCPGRAVGMRGQLHKRDGHDGWGRLLPVQPRHVYSMEKLEDSSLGVGLKVWRFLVFRVQG